MGTARRNFFPQAAHRTFAAAQSFWLVIGISFLRFWRI
jgi:hypothetical protein